MSAQLVQAQVAKLASAVRAKQAQRYFKTGPGEYGEGDLFAGLTNPDCRQIAAHNRTAAFEEIELLLQSRVHEERFIALVILEHRFRKEAEQAYQLYLRNLPAVNNWDLVDLSAPNIVGKYLFKRCQSFRELVEDDPRSILYQLAGSKSLWERRISMLSTLTLIRQGEFYDSLRLAALLLGDKEDLIHKAVGWMLREVGKRQLPLLESFIQQNYQQMPRTALRYSI
jgi:3-methyladenine DNA glycosylase AlkD